MNANRENKEKIVAAVRDAFSRSSTAVFLDFKGIDVETVTSLRAKFRKAGVQYRVVKNKLLKQALKGTPLEGNADLQKYFVGTTGVAWSFEDPSAAAKVVKAFRKEGDKEEKLGIKCGILETTIIPGERVETDLAGMPGKDEIRAMLLATFMAPAQKLVQQLTAPAQNFAYVLAAREQQLNEGK